MKTHTGLTNSHITSGTKVCSPAVLKRKVTQNNSAFVVQARRDIANIISGQDSRMLAIVGPCSIHDAQIGIEYANRLTTLIPKIHDVLYVVMRCYFEKPRTRLGWPGLIMDPHLNESNDIQQGLYLARSILQQITDIGIATGTEFLDPIVPQYLDDFISWASVGARTTESQIHRYMASGLSMPVGFKNGTQGSIDQAVNAMAASKSPHSFLGINQKGQIAVMDTTGHSVLHLILRGGSRPNYYPEDVQAAKDILNASNLLPAIVVDCSHGNSDKDIRNQPKVLANILEQRKAGQESLVGFMLESNLAEGNQELSTDKNALRFGVSITDACLGWEETEILLLDAAETLRA